MKRVSIRTRLLLGAAVGVALTFAVSSVLVYTLTRSQMYAQFDESLATRARALTALVEQEGDVIETDLGREDSAAEWHQLWRGEVVVRRSRSLGTRDLKRSPTTQEIVAIDRVELPDGRVGRQATIELQPHQDPEDGPPAPPITLTFALARDVDEVETTIAALRRVLLLVGLAATLLAVALLAAAVRLGLRPVRELAAAIAELRESNLGQQLDAARSPPELRSVVDRLNELLRRLEGAFARERELTADVAHELRTPLAGLRATIELARSRDRSTERYRAALDECHAICLQTERTLVALLSLARLDGGRETMTRETVQLDEVARSVVALHAARAAERKLTIETELAVVSRETDREKLRVVLQNLVENAVAYANEGGTVRIEVSERSIVVSNTGCTLATSDVERVFERFWRADKARSTSGHAGVGLALSKKLVELAGGTLAAEVIDGRFVATVVIA